MKRILLAGSFVVLALCGCQLPPEREPLKLLPEDRAPLPYPELAARARLLAQNANEAYYVNKWTDVEELAKGLEQTARFLPKAQDVPPKKKETLPKLSEDLAKASVSLRENAKEKDANKVLETMTRVQSLVRDLNVD